MWRGDHQLGAVSFHAWARTTDAVSLKLLASLARRFGFSNYCLLRRRRWRQTAMPRRRGTPLPTILLLLAFVGGACGTEILSKSRLESCSHDSDAGGRLKCDRKLVVDLAVPSGAVSKQRPLLRPVFLHFRFHHNQIRLCVLIRFFFFFFFLAERRRGVAGGAGGRGGGRERHAIGDEEHPGSPRHHRQQVRHLRALRPHLPRQGIYLVTVSSNQVCTS